MNAIILCCEKCSTCKKDACKQEGVRRVLCSSLQRFPDPFAGLFHFIA